MSAVRLPVILLGLTVAAAAGCSERPTEVEENGDLVEINMTVDFRFVPDDIVISPGTTVRWINDVTEFHTITARNPQQAGAWAEGQVTAAGQTFSHTFTQTGTFEYDCLPHITLGMSGRIRVE